MNKNDYLTELEQLLNKHKIDNTYTILREYDSMIDEKIKKGTPLADALSEIGNPSEILKGYLNNYTTTTKEENITAAIIDENVIEAEVMEEKIVEDKYGNDENNHEKTHQDQFTYSHFNERFHSKDQQRDKDNLDRSRYKNQFSKTSNSNKEISKVVLYLIIAVAVLVVLLRIISFFFWQVPFGRMNNMMLFNHDYFGLLKVIPGLLIAAIVIYVITQNNKE